jgi:hypothetical protein
MPIAPKYCKGYGPFRSPFGPDSRWGSKAPVPLDRLLGGGEIGGSAVAETGHPATVFSPANTLSSVVRTPASCTGCSRGMFKVRHDKASQTLNYLTPAQIAKFSTPPPGQFSNVGRNYFRLAPYSVLTLSIGKSNEHCRRGRSRHGGERLACRRELAADGTAFREICFLMCSFPHRSLTSCRSTSRTPGFQGAAW